MILSSLKTKFDWKDTTKAIEYTTFGLEVACFQRKEAVTLGGFNRYHSASDAQLYAVVNCILCQGDRVLDEG